MNKYQAVIYYKMVCQARGITKKWFESVYRDAEKNFPASDNDVTVN